MGKAKPFLQGKKCVDWQHSQEFNVAGRLTLNILIIVRLLLNAAVVESNFINSNINVNEL